MTYPHMIVLQKRDDGTGKWPDGGDRYHAKINKASDKNEYLSAGAVQSQSKLVFTLRYCKAVAAIRGSTQLYRILYGGLLYKIVDFDDYREQHREIKLLGVSYV